MHNNVFRRQVPDVIFVGKARSLTLLIKFVVRRQATESMTSSYSQVQLKYFLKFKFQFEKPKKYYLGR